LADIREALSAGELATSAQKLDGKQLQAARDLLEQATMPLAALLMDGVAKKALSGKSLSEL
jgi:hypothetical protein